MAVEDAADLAGMFDADDFAVSALWKAGGVGSGVAVAVILDHASVDTAGFGVPLRASARTVRLPVASAPLLAKGDTFTIGADVLTVGAAPRRDGPDGAIWTAEC